MALWQNLKTAYRAVTDSKPLVFWKQWGRFAWMPISAGIDIKYSEDVAPPALGNLGAISAALVMRNMRGALPFILPTMAYAGGRALGYKLIGKTPWARRGETIKARIVDTALLGNQPQEVVETTPSSIEALRHDGIAGDLRAQNTDFGSGYQGIGKRQRSQRRRYVNDPNQEFAFFASSLEKYGQKVGTAHKRILIPRSILTEQELTANLGFLETAIAIPEAGQTRTKSFRHPTNLFHLHEHGPMWSMHKDLHPSATMLLKSDPENKFKNILKGTTHLVTEGVPGAYYWARGKLQGSSTMGSRLINEIDPQYWRDVNAFSGYQLPGHVQALAKSVPAPKYHIGKALALGVSLGAAGGTLYGVKGAAIGGVGGAVVGYGTSAILGQLDNREESAKSNFLRTTLSTAAVVTTYDLATDTGLLGFVRGGVFLSESSADKLAKTKFGQIFEKLTGRSVASPTGLTFKLTDLTRNLKPTSELGSRLLSYAEQFFNPLLLNPALTDEIERAGSLAAFNKSKYIKGALKNVALGLPGSFVLGATVAHISRLRKRNKAPNAIKGHDEGRWGREQIFASGDFEPGSSWKGIINRVAGFFGYTQEIRAAISATRAAERTFGPAQRAVALRRASEAALQTRGKTLEGFVRSVGVQPVNTTQEWLQAIGMEGRAEYAASASARQLVEEHVSGLLRGRGITYDAFGVSMVSTHNVINANQAVKRARTAFHEASELFYMQQGMVNPALQATLRHTNLGVIYGEAAFSQQMGLSLRETLGALKLKADPAQYKALKRVTKQGWKAARKTNQPIIKISAHDAGRWDRETIFADRKFIGTLPGTLKGPGVGTTEDLRRVFRDMQTQTNLQLAKASQISPIEEKVGTHSSKLTRMKMDIGQQQAQSLPFEMHAARRRSHGKTRTRTKK